MKDRSPLEPREPIVPRGNLSTLCVHCYFGLLNVGTLLAMEKWGRGVDMELSSPIIEYKKDLICLFGNKSQ